MAVSIVDGKNWEFFIYIECWQEIITTIKQQIRWYGLKTDMIDMYRASVL